MERRTAGIILIMGGMVLVLFCGGVSAVRIGDLPGVQPPIELQAREGRLYIADAKSELYIFQLNNHLDSLRLEKKLKIGAMKPEAFSGLLRVYPGCLKVQSRERFLCFTHRGKLLQEEKLPFQGYGTSVYEMGNRYVVREMDFGPDTTETRVLLFDGNCRLICSLGIYTDPGGFCRKNPLMNTTLVRIYQDKIYLGRSGEETFIRVFDQRGEMLREIRPRIAPVRVGPEFRECCRRRLSLSGDSSADSIEGWRKSLDFPSVTPGMDYFEITGGRIILRTYQIKGSRVMFTVYGLSGDLVQKIYLPDTGQISGGASFCFAGDHYFYTRWNPDRKTWELHQIPLQ